MEDNDIINLYFERNESALEETQTKYGKLLKKLAINVLNDEEEADECLNDVLLAAWNQIPPNHPNHLLVYLAKSIRYIAFGKLDYHNAQKRKATIVELCTEIEQDILSHSDTESALAGKELTVFINRFLSTQKSEQRIIFVRRYWYGDSLEDIAKHLHISMSKVKSSLFRTRKKLQTYLENEGIFL